MPQEENGLGDGEWIEKTVRLLLVTPLETRFVPFLPDTKQIARTLVRDATTFEVFLAHVRAGAGKEEGLSLKMVYTEPILLALGLGILRAVEITRPGAETPMGYITVTAEGMWYHAPLDPEVVAEYEAYIARSDQQIAARFSLRLNTLRRALNSIAPRVPQNGISPAKVEFQRATSALKRLELSNPGDHWRDTTMGVLASHVDGLRALAELLPGLRFRGGI
jgi:hypothetical protein